MILYHYFLFTVVNNGTYPPLPKLPTQFQTRVEANLLDKGLTITAKEYYDELGNRAAVHTIQNNTEDYMILDYLNDQIYTITSEFIDVWFNIFMTNGLA